MSETRLILVIGATGAQGLAVINALLRPGKDGKQSPYRIRALTRDPSHPRAKELTEKGVECVKGSFTDFAAVKLAMEGCYGAFVNTDSFTVGEEKEIYCGMRIFEIAKTVSTMRHYVWSNLVYVMKKAGYREEYKAEHLDGKGRVGEWLKAQPSIVSDSDMSWTSLTTGPYTDTLNGPFGPITKRADGTHVFCIPIGDGHVHFITLADIGFFARYIFDRRAETSAQDLEVASEVVTWNEVVETFKRVTGEKAEYKRLTIDEWWELFADPDAPVATDLKHGDGSTTARQNFSAFFRIFRDDIVKRDMDWVRSIHPGVQSVEEWMRVTGYRGVTRSDLLKQMEDGKGFFTPIPEKIAQL